MVAYVAFDRLPDPPAGVCREFRSYFRVEAQGGFSQAQGAFGDEVVDLGPLVGVFRRDFQDQPHVAEYELFERHFGALFVAPGDQPAKRFFLFGGQQLVRGDAVQGQTLFLG